MDTNLKINPIPFSSLHNPIKPFKLKVNGDIINFSEIDYNKNQSEYFYKNIAQFFTDIFCKSSSHPYWTDFRPPHRNTKKYNQYIRITKSELKSEIEDPDTTLLIGKNRYRRTVAAILARALYLNNDIKDGKTLYIDSIAINPDYRGHNVGRNILQEVINTCGEHFNDIFLVAYKESVPFYQKIGFKKFIPSTIDDKFVIKKLSEYRIDYPSYAEFMIKNIGNKEDTWISRIIKNYIMSEE